MTKMHEKGYWNLLFQSHEKKKHGNPQKSLRNDRYWLKSLYQSISVYIYLIKISEISKKKTALLTYNIMQWYYDYTTHFRLVTPSIESK